jgi:hypothetical protein
MQAGWTFDLGTPESICLLVFGGTGGVEQGFGVGVIALDSSNDNTTWTSQATPSEILGNLVPGSSGAIAAVPTASSTAFRYWRLTFSWTRTGGLGYFRGYDFNWVAMYKAALT